jgi:hypothetical protein
MLGQSTPAFIQYSCPNYNMWASYFAAVQTGKPISLNKQNMEAPLFKVSVSVYYAQLSLRVRDLVKHCAVSKET